MNGKEADVNALATPKGGARDADPDRRVGTARDKVLRRRLAGDALPQQIQFMLTPRNESFANDP